MQRFYEIGKEAVRPRKNGELSAFLILSRNMKTYFPLVIALERAGVKIVYPGPFTIDGVEYPPLTPVIPMDQPYAGFAKALLELQHYPDLRDNKGNPIAPYDVTAHTLSVLTGVEVKAIYKSFSYSSVSNGGIWRSLFSLSKAALPIF